MYFSVILAPLSFPQQGESDAQSELCPVLVPRVPGVKLMSHAYVCGNIN